MVGSISHRLGFRRVGIRRERSGARSEVFASTGALVEGDMVLPFDGKVVDVLVGISPEVPLVG